MKQPMRAGLLQGYGEMGQWLAEGCLMGLPEERMSPVVLFYQKDLVLFLCLLPELEQTSLSEWPSQVYPRQLFREAISLGLQQPAPVLGLAVISNRAFFCVSPEKWSSACQPRLNVCISSCSYF